MSDEFVQTNPVTYGDTTVWMSNRNSGILKGVYDVYAFDVTSGVRRLTNVPTASGGLGIYGNMVIWTDIRNADPAVTSHAENDPVYNQDIYAYDLVSGKEKQITNHNGNDRNPVINGTNVVWLRQMAYNKANVYLYDLSTSIESQISTSDYAAGTPSIYGRQIVWEDARLSDGNTSGDVIMNGVRATVDIYLYDMDTRQETRLTSSEPGKVWDSPVITGYYVVCTWSRQVGPITYVLHLSQNTVVTEVNSTLPASETFYIPPEVTTSPTPPTPWVPEYDILDGTQWILLSLNGSPPVGDSKITLSFNNSSVGGFSGVNMYGGAKYSVDNINMTIAIPVLTSTAIGSPLNAQEKVYYQALRDARTFKLTGGGTRLEFYNSANQVVLVFER